MLGGCTRRMVALWIEDSSPSLKQAHRLERRPFQIVEVQVKSSLQDALIHGCSFSLGPDAANCPEHLERAL